MLTVFLVPQARARGHAAVHARHSLPLPHPQLAASGRGADQRGVWHADFPQCFAAKDPEG